MMRALLRCAGRGVRGFGLAGAVVEVACLDRGEDGVGFADDAHDN